MLLNYYIEQGDATEQTATTQNKNKAEKDVRIRVNDKTASGGWY